MSEGEALVRGISQILGRGCRISGLDPRSGTFELHNADQTVPVTLALDLLAEYFHQLDEHDLPDLSHAPQDAQDHIRAKHIALQIEEIFESDISLSLLDIRLGRSADGRIRLVDRRGTARRSLPPASTENGYWSPDRPDT